MKIPNPIKNLFRKESVCKCAWRTEPGRRHLKYDAKLQLFDLELVPDTPTGGVMHIGFSYCPECGKRIAPLLPHELMRRDEEVPAVERQRLADLAVGPETYDQVFTKLGQPDCEVRSVRYDRLSPSASLSFYSGTGEKLKFFITPNWNRVKKGQQIAPPNGGPVQPPGSSKAGGGPPSVS